MVVHERHTVDYLGQPHVGSLLGTQSKRYLQKELMQIKLPVGPMQTYTCIGTQIDGHSTSRTFSRLDQLPVVSICVGVFLTSRLLLTCRSLSELILLGL